MTATIVIVLLILSFIIQIFLTQYFYLIGWADFPPGDNPIGILQVFLLPFLFFPAKYISKEFSKGSNRGVTLIFKVLVIPFILGIIIFGFIFYLTTRDIPSSLYRQAKMYSEQGEYIKSTQRYYRLIRDYPNFVLKNPSIPNEFLEVNKVSGYYTEEELMETGKELETLKKNLKKRNF